MLIRSMTSWLVALHASRVTGKAVAQVHQLRRETDPYEVYRDAKLAWKLSRAQLAVLREICAWREQSPAQGQAILLSPLVRPKDWGWSKFSYYLLRPFVKGIARRFSENSNDPDFLPFLQADPLQPVRLPTAWVGALARWIPRIEQGAAPSSRRPLVIQGQADKTVDWQHNLEVLKARFNQPQVLLLPEARHHLANETPEIRARYFAFLDKFF